MSVAAVLVAGLLLSEPGRVDLMQSILDRMKSSEHSWTSRDLMEAVRGAPIGRQEAAMLAPRIIAAWNAHRSSPPIEVGELAAVFQSKRDSIEAIDVEYRVSLIRRGDGDSGAAPSPIVWWVRWAQDQYAIHRSVAATRVGLANPLGDSTAMAWRTDGQRLWFSRAGGVLREVDSAGLSMVGMEDSWLGAGGCIGRRSDGTARAAEHDLAAMLAGAVDGTVIVESEERHIDGVAVVAVRLGWESPCWIYLDPARGFAPVRIERWLEDNDGRVLARSDMHNFRRLAGGVQMPERVTLRQYRLEAGQIPHAAPYLELCMEVAAVAVNTPIEWGQVVPRWDREPE
jgi:hypothetical protein